MLPPCQQYRNSREWMSHRNIQLRHEGVACTRISHQGGFLLHPDQPFVRFRGRQNRRQGRFAVVDLHVKRRGSWLHLIDQNKEQGMLSHIYKHPSTNLLAPRCHLARVWNREALPFHPHSLQQLQAVVELPQCRP